MTKQFPETLPYWSPDDPDATAISLAGLVDDAISAPLIETHELANAQLEAIVAITDGYARAISSTISADSSMAEERKEELNSTAKQFRHIAELARNQLARLAEFRQPGVTDPG